VAIADLKIKLFADGADKTAMLDLYRNPSIRGFTTNPTQRLRATFSRKSATARFRSRSSPTSSTRWKGKPG
jgi:transaldolase